MHILANWAELAIYLNSSIDPNLKCLLQTRYDQLKDYGDLAELGIFVIVHPDDTMSSIEDATAWPIMIDGTPTFEWAARHDAWIEVPFISSDSGAGHVLFVPDADGIDRDLLDLCRSYVDQPNDGSAGETETP